MINLLSVPSINLEGNNHHFELPPILNFPRGLYANAIEEKSGDLLVWRDPLGAHKIFYARAADRQWVVANRIDDLIAAGISLGDIHSCPGGALIRINDHGYTVVNSCHPHNLPEDDSLSTKNLFIKVDERLSIAFQSLAKSYGEARFSVCLSGGLDSTIIAYYAKKYLPNITAFSFSFVDGSSTSQYPIKGGPSNHGTVVGIGYKQFIMDQWYGFFDYSYTVQSGGNYKLIADANTSANWYSEKLRTELFMLGVGYKF